MPRLLNGIFYDELYGAGEGLSETGVYSTLMSLLGENIDRVIDDSDSDVLPGVERLLRLHASAVQNWRCLIELEDVFVSGHLQEDNEGTDSLWYDSLEDLERYEKRAKGALHMGEEKAAVLERRQLAENASNLPNVEWAQIKELYHRAIDTAESAGLRERSVLLRVSLTTAAIKHEVSKSEITSLWGSMMDSWRGEPAATVFSEFHTLAEEAVKSPVVKWSKISELYRKMISACEDTDEFLDDTECFLHDTDFLPQLYWQLAELAEKSESTSSEISSELYSNAIRSFKSSPFSMKESVPKKGQVRKFEQVVKVEEGLSLDCEETKSLYKGAIRDTSTTGALYVREERKGEGFSVEYTPLSGFSDADFNGDTTRDDIMRFLTSSPEWKRRQNAQNHLVELRRLTKEQLEETHCPNGTKKELIQLLVGECDVGVIAGGFRPAELAELVECSEGHAKKVAVRNPESEVRGSDRDAVLENDDGLRKKNQCAACGRDSSLQVHHIMSDGGKQMRNLATLCRPCHREVHSNMWGSVLYDTIDDFWTWVENHQPATE